MGTKKVGFIETHLKKIITIIILVSMAIALIGTTIFGIWLEYEIMQTGEGGHFSIYYIFNLNEILLGDELDGFVIFILLLWYFILFCMFLAAIAHLAIPSLIILLICAVIERHQINKKYGINIHTMPKYMNKNTANTGNNGENRSINNTSYNNKETVKLNKEQ